MALYHDHLELDVAAAEPSLLPTLAIAFNAGAWGYDSWNETLSRCSQATTGVAGTTGAAGFHFIFTAYTLEECDDDHDKIVDIVSLASKKGNVCVFEPEANTLGSRMARVTSGETGGRTYRESAAWQGWWFKP